MKIIMIQKEIHISILKFVPASGAATRMFKTLFHQFFNHYNPEKETINSFINKNKNSSLSIFLVGIEKFPFYKTVLKESMKYIIQISIHFQMINKNT